MPEDTAQLGEAADLATPAPDATPDQDDAQQADSTPPAGDAGADDDAQLDALIDTLRSGKDREDAQRSYATAKPRPQTAATPTEPATAAGEQARTGTTPAPAAAQPAAAELDDEAASLLGRFHVKPATFAKLDPDERGELLANLRTRHNDGVRMFQELQSLKRQGGQPAQPAEGQQPAKPAAAAPAADPLSVLEEAWKANYGDDVPLVPQLRAAIEGMVNPLREQAQASQQQAQAAQSIAQQFLREAEESDKSDGVKAVKDLATRAGVNLDLRTTEGKANHERLLATAERFLQAERMRLGQQWDRRQYGYQHAISDAFASTFRPQNLLAQRRSAAEAAVQAARRGGETSGLPARGQPKRSEDDALDDVYEATKTHGREAGVRVAAGRT